MRTWIPHPYGMGLKHIGLAALVPRAGKRTERKWKRINAFVIPNIVSTVSERK
ncbi:hypothetical protein [Tannerella forsythia]|uniref:hypothetical protein n=1 Tax=Tannerella forsythia TaxID=28112 RepID=UPI0015CF1729|nr:hypothetical protein [Tannerella forsythia]